MMLMRRKKGLMMLMRRKKGFFPGGIVAPRGPISSIKEIIKIIKIIIF
jgi:hypothetical protein